MGERALSIDAARLRREAAALGPWFHNLHLPGDVETNPGHPFGDFPAFKWQAVAPHIPQDLTGRRVLDIGCNGGYYSLAMAERNADVTAIDIDPAYLRQARWAREVCGLDNISVEQRSVYDVDRLSDSFDIVLFMGVFYHLRYPLLALDLVARLRPGLLVFQTLTYGEETGSREPKPDVGFAERDRLSRPDWPQLAFLETGFAGDPTNWWAANPAAVEALLRSSGFRVVARPAHEIWLCRTAEKHSGASAVEDMAAAEEAGRRLQRLRE
jgi:tRNA (mo5U34)-methyltransferase